MSSHEGFPGLQRVSRGWEFSHAPHWPAPELTSSHAALAIAASTCAPTYAHAEELLAQLMYMYTCISHSSSHH